MFSVLFRSVRPVTQLRLKQLNASLIQNYIAREVPIKNFHSSQPRAAALPPVVLLLLRPILKGFAFFAGRNFRKWWQALPKEKRWNLAGIYCLKSFSLKIMYTIFFFLF